MNPLVLTGLLATGLSLVHVLAGHLLSREGVPRKRLLSFAGGISVAYVFVHILPELNRQQQTLEQTGIPLVDLLEHHVYLLALAGLAAFYGLERSVSSARSKEPEDEQESGRDFWLHIGAFFLYNALIGYLLLHQEGLDALDLALFATAMGLHLAVNDNALRDHHESLYDRVGRWLLALAVLAGWGAGAVVDIGEAALAFLFALLSGGIVLNVLKEELPEERESHVGAFALGAALFALLLLLIEP